MSKYTKNRFRKKYSKYELSNGSKKEDDECSSRSEYWPNEDSNASTSSESRQKLSRCDNSSRCSSVMATICDQGYSENIPKLISPPMKQQINLQPKTKSVCVKNGENFERECTISKSRKSFPIQTLISSSISRRIRFDSLWLTPLSPVPFREAGIVWNGIYRRSPAFVFSPTVMMSRNSSVKLLGSKLNLSCKIIKTDCRLLRTILLSHGFNEANASSPEFNLIWTSSHLKPFHLKSLADFHRVNHFPKSYELTRKDNLALNIQKMQRLKGDHHFDFLPVTFVLPKDFADLNSHYLKEYAIYIVKPNASSRGRGIYLVSNPESLTSTENVIVSRYISNPLLIDGFKFDLRLYVAVTSYNPLIIYVYEEGLARFATVRFHPGIRHVKNMCMHLTNYSVNKKNQDFVHNDDADVEDFGNKWTLGALLRYLRSEGKDTAGLMLRIEDIIIKSFIAVEGPIAKACHVFQPFKDNCFELYGFDIIVDENLRPWLLEVNLSPSLGCDTPLDFKVKSNMLSDLLSLAGIVCHDPNRKYSGSQNYTSMTYSGIHNFTAPKHPSYFVPASHYSVADGHKATCHSSKNARSGIVAGTSSNGSKTLIKRNSSTSSSVHSRFCAYPKDLSKDESSLVRRLQEEAARCGGWLRLLPNSEAWEQYSSLYGIEQSSSPTDVSHTGGWTTKSASFSSPTPGNVPDVISHSTTAVAIAAMHMVNSRALNFRCTETSETTLFHPNLLPPYVNLGMFTGLADTDPCNSILSEQKEISEDDGFSAIISLPSALQVLSNFNVPLHSLPPKMLAECLMIVLGYVNSKFQLNKEQATRIAACYSLTLGRLPFYHRKLGSAPICVRGVCLVAGCTHIKSKNAKFCGVQVIRDWKKTGNLTVESKPSLDIEIVDNPASPTVELERPFQANSYLEPKQIKLMTKVQARNAFSVYLSRIHTRIKNQIHEANNQSEKNIKKGEDQIELMVQFLRKAAVNLSPQAVISICNETGSEIVRKMNKNGMFKIPAIDSNMPMKDKRILLAHVLDIFICVYMFDTARNCNDEFLSNEKGIEASVFRSFIHSATESELEVMLAEYTRIHKSVSLFIGPSSASGDLMPEEDLSHQSMTSVPEDGELVKPSVIKKTEIMNLNSLQRTFRTKSFKHLNNKEELIRVPLSKDHHMPQNACFTVSHCRNSKDDNQNEDFAFVVTKKKGFKQSKCKTAYAGLQRSCSNSTAFPSNFDPDIDWTGGSADTLLNFENMLPSSNSSFIDDELSSNSVVVRFREPLSSLDAVSCLMKPYKPSEYRVGKSAFEGNFQREQNIEINNRPNVREDVRISSCVESDFSCRKFKLPNLARKP